MDPPSNYLFGKVAHVPACFFFFNSFQFFLLLLSLQLLIQSSKILLNFFINLSFKLFLNNLLIHFFKIISNSFINKFLLDLLLSFANFDSKLDFVLSDEILQGQEIIIGLDLCFGSVGVAEEDGDGVGGLPEEEGSFVGDAGEG